MGRKVARSTETRISELARSFLNVKKLSGCAESTLKIYAKWIGALSVIAPTTDELPPEAILQLLADVRGRGLKPNTVAQVWRSVKCFTRWLLKTRTILVDPMASLDAPRLPKEQRPAPSDEDVAAWLRTCDDRSTLVDARDYAMFLTAIDSGVRRAELVSLTIADYHPEDHGRLDVRHGKGAKDRKTFVGKETAKAIAHYMMMRPPIPPDDNGAAPLFADITGKPLKPRHIFAILQRRSKKAGLAKHIAPHAMRRRALTSWGRARMPLPMMQRLAGHANASTTQVYLDIVAADLQAAHEAASATDTFMASLHNGNGSNGHQKTPRQARGEEIAAARRQLIPA